MPTLATRRATILSRDPCLAVLCCVADERSATSAQQRTLSVFRRARVRSRVARRTQVTVKNKIKTVVDLSILFTAACLTYGEYTAD